MNSKQKVLFVLLDEYTDWEGAFLSTALHVGVIPGSEVKYSIDSENHWKGFSIKFSALFWILMTDNGGNVCIPPFFMCRRIRLTSKFYSAGGREWNSTLGRTFREWSGMKFHHGSRIPWVVGNGIPPWVAHSVGGCEWNSTLGRTFRGWLRMKFHLGVCGSGKK